MQKVILYTPATLDGGWFLATIDCAIWLSKKNSVEEIHVISYPINKCLNPFRFLLKVKNFLHYVKKLRRGNKISCHFQDVVLNQNDELHQFMTNRINEFSINHKSIKIRFIRMPFSFKRIYLLELLSNIKTTIQIYMNYFTNNKLRYKKYLNFKSENYYPGFTCQKQCDQIIRALEVYLIRLLAS